MELAPCRFRQVTSAGELSCALVQQILGATTADHCLIDEAVCRACGALEIPQASRPNAVVSSLIYNAAREIQRLAPASRDKDVGRAWQAERYILRSLAEEPGGSAQREPPEPTLRRMGGLVGRLIKRARGAATRTRRPSIGLVGYGSASGLGYLNRDMAAHDGVDAWLLVDRGQPTIGDAPDQCASVVRVASNAPKNCVKRWLKDLDWVVWAETSPFEFLPELARQVGTRVACVPMWEWTSPNDSWLRMVDLLICPTRHAYRMFVDWRRRFGFDWRVEYFPWPVAVDRFPFRRRDLCRMFVFVNGQGGAWANELTTDARLGPRKGLDTVLAAAALTPEISWRVYSQAEVSIAAPANVEIRPGPADRSELYREGDVCVQPSRWEGLGLPLLECQAAGMPLITVDAPPMNEYHALRRVPAAHWRWGRLTEAQPIQIPELSPHELADAVRQLHASDIRQASANARAWICRDRSWHQAVHGWRAMFLNNPRDEVYDAN